MRKAVALLVGLGIAIFLGWLYMKFSGPLVYREPTAAAVPVNPPDRHNWLLYLIVLFSWITAYMSMPQWLGFILDLLFGWVAVGLFVVTGVLVWLAQPNNTLQDSTYVAFLCSIAILVPRLTRLFR